MKKIGLIALVLASAAIAGTAQAEVKTHKAAQVSLDVPAGWKGQGDENNMVLLDPKEEVMFVLRIVEGSELQKALNDADVFIAKQIEKPTWKDKKDVKLNGMNSITREGTGTYKGKPVDVGVLVIATPSKKFLLVLALIDHSAAAAHKTEVRAFVNSIKPAAP